MTPAASLAPSLKVLNKQRALIISCCVVEPWAALSGRTVGEVEELPALLQLLAQHARMQAESKAVTRTAPGQNLGLTPDPAQP